MQFTDGKWHYFKFTGQTKWNEIVDNTEDKLDQIKYMLNAYRELLTRARQGMISCVPEGNNHKTTNGFWEDSKPEYYNGTYKYLKDLSHEEL